MRYRFIGDTILTVPFLRNLREQYPQAKIDVLVGPKSGEVLEGCPYVDELIKYDTTRFHKYDSGDGKPRNLFSYALQLRRKKYDRVYVLKRSFSAGLLAFLTGAKERIGYRGDGWFFLTTSVPFDTSIHEVDSLLQVLSASGVKVTDRSLEAFVDEPAVAAVKSLEPALHGGPFVLIHAASAHPDKTYPLMKWAKIVSRLYNELGLVAVFSGDKQDQETYKELARLSGTPYIDMSGRLSLRQSMALYTLMKLSVCVDSGPAHLCAACGVPTVTLFGPTDPSRWRPYGDKHRAVYDESLACRPCHYKKTCQNRECLTELSEERVFQIIQGVNI